MQHSKATHTRLETVSSFNVLKSITFSFFSLQGKRAEFFRLNELSLWLELVTNPEACCMKWVSEADYVMPLLTPQFLSEIHAGNSREEEEEMCSSSSLLPMSPLINRFMYTLLRARFANEKCRNKSVRPVIPTNYERQVGNSTLVKQDPIFRLVWVSQEAEKLKGRIRSMLCAVQQQ